MKRRSNPIRAVDLFAGAGGTSTGLALAAAALGRPVELTAVNHWDIAVETHAANHPWANHYCAQIDSLDPRKIVRSRVDLLVASPECTHHSNARGGRPMSDQSRATAWCVVRWADALQPRAILVENVQEFRTWGPLTTRGRPMRSRAGETYEAWLQALRSLGYRVAARVLCAADFGDPTTRRRLFVIAWRGRGDAPWALASHARGGGRDLFGELAPWRPAREVIDWTLPGASIFERKRPLAANTLARIAEGLRCFGGDAAEPFLAILTHGARVRSVDDPFPTVTGANRGELALVEPFVLQQQSGGVARPVSAPMPTLAAKGAVSLVEPFLVPRYGERATQTPRTHSVSDPMPTVPATCQHGLVEPFLLAPLGIGRGNAHRSCDLPLGTVLATRGGGHIVQPFMVRYHGTGGAESIERPVPTITARDRFGLVEPVRLDIRFRMLAPHELAAAQGFPRDYQFRGNRTQVVRQVGNAVPVNTASALCGAILRGAA